MEACWPPSLLGALLKAALGPALWVVVGLSLAAAGHATWRLSSLRKLNADIHALVSGRDLAVDPGSAPGELNLARTNELLRRDRLDEAQALAAVASPRLAPAGNAKLLYNLANYRLRQARQHISSGDIDGATALVNLSKGEYRIGAAAVAGRLGHQIQSRRGAPDRP